MANASALKVLGIPGSLRSGSFNRRLLELARDLAPAILNIEIYNDLGSVMPLNEDLEGHDYNPPLPVLKLRRAVESADAILLATPEYNQSMPGVLKNAIDWLSRPAPASAFLNKPVALCGITPGGWGTRLSQAALRQTLFAAEARLVPLHLYLRSAESLLPEVGGAAASLTEELREFLEGLARELQQEPREMVA
jgi:chromate reductase